MGKQITAKKFFGMTEADRQNFMFDVNAGFLQALHDFGIELPKRFEKIGCFTEYSDECVDRYGENRYGLFARRANDNRGLDVGISLHNDNVFWLNGVREDMSIGAELLAVILSPWFYEPFTEASLETALVNRLLNGQAMQNIEYLAKLGFLSKRSLVRTWNQLTAEYKSERYALLGYKGPEAQDHARLHPSVWNRFNKTPREIRPAFKSLVDNIAWVNLT